MRVKGGKVFMVRVSVSVSGVSVRLHVRGEG